MYQFSLVDQRLLRICKGLSPLFFRAVFWRLVSLLAQLLLLWIAAYALVYGVGRATSSWDTLETGMWGIPEMMCGLTPWMFALGLGCAFCSVVMLRVYALRQAMRHDTLAGTQVAQEIRAQLTQAVLQVGPAYATYLSSTQLVRMASWATNSFETFVGGYGAQLVTHALATILLAGCISCYHTAAGVSILVGNLLLILLLHGMLALVTKIQDAYLNSYDEVSDAFMRAMEGLTTLKVFGTTSAMTALIAKKNEAVAVHTLKLLKMQLISVMLFDLLIFGSSACAAYEALRALVNQELSVAGVIAICMMVTALVIPGRTLVQQFHSAMLGVACGRHVGSAMRALEQMADCLPWRSKQPLPGVDSIYPYENSHDHHDGSKSECVNVSEAPRQTLLPRCSDEALDGGLITSSTPDAASDICFGTDSSAVSNVQTLQEPWLLIDGVQVTYPQSAHLALVNLSCALTGPALVAIVGASGSGKSTLLRMLIREIVPHDLCCVRLYGRNLFSYESEQLSQLTAFMSHNAHIFAGTLRQNLLMHRPNATDEEMYQALGSVNLLDMVQARGGLDAVVDAGGTNFSGGQRQRIALARTLLSPADILLFDEPTSSVDIESEHIIAHALIQASQQRLVLCVTHNLMLAQEAQQILVMDRGRLVGEGTHDDVMCKSPEYQRLWQAQHELMTISSRRQGGEDGRL